MHEHELQQLFDRIADIPPFVVQAHDGALGEPRPWFTADARELQQLRTTASDLPRLRMVTAMMLGRWGRALAATKRVWQWHDRRLREWQAAQTIALHTPPEDEAQRKAWKAPSVAATEAHYRTRPEYSRLYQAVEEAQEAHTATQGVLDAWTAISEMLTKE